MKRSIGGVREGDKLSARHYTKIAQAAHGMEMAGPAAGQSGIVAGGFSGTTTGDAPIKMVRIIHPVISEASDQYAGNTEQNRDAAKYNAWVQVYDPSAKQWVDEPGGEKVFVSLADDDVGWQPLERFRRLPVFWHEDASRWVPLERTEASVVMLTGSTADANGFKPGVRFVFNSDTLAWVVVEDILIIDVGA